MKEVTGATEVTEVTKDKKSLGHRVTEVTASAYE